jgi:penicillin-binding protein 1A
MAHKRRRRWGRWFVFLVVLGVLGAFAAPHVLKAVAGQMPEPKDIPQPQVTTVLDVKGREIGKLGTSHREVANCSDISPYMPFAAMAAENPNFYNEEGVSWFGMMRAFVVNAREGRIAQGGSGITQQYVKNKYLTPERTYGRKLRETALAAKVEQDTPKDRILCNYLNTIYFGRGAYGVKAAAKQWFNLNSADDLTLAQASYLAAIIQNPSKSHAEALARRNQYVLETMLNMWNDPKDKYKVRGNRPDKVYDYQLSTQAVATARATKPKLRSTDKLLGAAASRAPHIVNLVEEYLVAKYGSNAIQLGLRVKTTVDLDWQRKLNSIVTDVTNGRPEPRVGATVLDAKSAGIRAMYGGRNLTSQAYDASHDVHRQSGSTMKPVVLAEALRQDIPTSTVMDAPATMDVEWKDSNGDKQNYHVENYHETGYGRLNLKEAMWKSTNTVYVPLAVEVGVDKVADLAKKMGATDTLIPGEKPPEVPELPSTAIGANDMNTIQAASMYATLANRGVHKTPYLIEEIRDAQGDVIEKHESNDKRVLDENVADTVNQVLFTNTSNGSARVANIGVPSAGKTGTTNDVHDVRYNGYTTSAVMAVWEGNTKQSTLTNMRGRMPADIWRPMMRYVSSQKGYEAGEFAKPDPEIKGKQKEEEKPEAKPTPKPTPSPTPKPKPTPTQASTTPTPTPSPTPTATRKSPKPSPTSSSTTPATSTTPSPTETPGRRTPNGTPTPTPEQG